MKKQKLKMNACRILMLGGIALLAARTNTYAQVGTTYIQLRVKSDEVRAAGTNGLLTKTSALNDLLQSYGAVKYVQLYEGAKTEGLTEDYIIDFTGNAVSFEAALKATNYFTDIEIVPYAEPLCISSYSVNDPYLVTNPDGSQWTANNYPIELMKLKCAWDITEGSDKITIAIIDTEFDIYHEDLQGKFSGPITNLTNFTQTEHGTRVFGAAMAKVNNAKGAAGSGNKTMGAGYRVSGSEIAQGIWQAYRDGHKIINVSWSGNGLSTAAATEMTQNGVSIVVAAGNSVTNNYHANIANIPGVIMVSGHNGGGNIGPTGHARNANVDIVAPSVDIFSSANTQDGLKYSMANGTSMAAPLVCGVIALMKSVNNCLSPVQIEDIIKNTASPVGDAALYPGLFGAGRVNAHAAVVAAQGYNNQVNIASTTTWLTDRFVYGDIIIQSGRTLTIKSTVKMGCDVKIIVRPGAKLVIDGGTITRVNNGKLWKGIELWGNKNASSLAANQGSLEMKNNATISYARLAVRNWSEENYAQGGGIINVSNSKFINCRRAVELNDYPNYTYWTNINAGQSNCSFSNTEFLIDDPFCLYTASDGSMGLPYPFSSWMTKDGIVIKNCTFKSLLTDNDITVATQRGTGVHLSESGGLVSNNLFEGYARGVHVTSVTGTPSRTVKIYNNTLKKNRHSILVAANGNTDIRGNTIKDMPVYSNNVQTVTDNVGIFVVHSKGTYIGCTNNISFDDQTGFANWNTYNKPFGIVLKENLEGSNTVSNNKFRKLDNAVHYQGPNPFISLYDNDYTGDLITRAINIEGMGTTPFSSFGAGCNVSNVFIKKTAGNRFNTTSSTIRNVTTNPAINYYYRSGIANQQPTFASGPWTMQGCSSSGSALLECYTVEVHPGGPVLALKLAQYAELVDEGLRYTADCEELVGEIMRTYNDQDDINGLADFLEADNTVFADIMLLPLSIELADEDKYMATKDRLMTRGSLSSDEKEAYFSYFDFILNLRQENRALNEMTEGEIALVKELAYSDFMVSGYAKALRDQSGEEPWEHIVTYTEDDDIPFSATAQLKQEGISVYPNPTGSVFSITINTKEVLKNAMLEIVGINGNSIYKKMLADGVNEINLNAREMHMTEGIYLIKLKAGSKLIDNKKLVIKY